MNKKALAVMKEVDIKLESVRFLQHQIDIIKSSLHYIEQIESIEINQPLQNNIKFIDKLKRDVYGME